MGPSADTTFALAAATPPAWGVRAAAALPVLLLDQAHLETKAAAAANRLLFRVATVPWLQRALSRLAREELLHFERTLQLLERRGIAFERLEPAPYAEQLKRACRAPQHERLVDELLVAAVIEARSHERMRALAGALAGRDAEAAGFYADLCAAEERHHLVYVEIAAALATPDAVARRWPELARHEAAVLAGLPWQPRLHGGWRHDGKATHG